MNRIIVTIRIKQKKEYDLELPVNQKIKDLMQDISDSLEGETPGIHPEDTLSAGHLKVSYLNHNR